ETGTSPRREQRRERVPPLELVTPIRDENERAETRQSACKVVEELARRRVRPVDVFDHEEEAALARRRRQQGDDRLEEPELRLSGVAPLRVLAARSELRKELGQLLPRGAELGGDPFRVLAGEIVPDRLDDREVRERQLRLAAPARKDGAVESACALR